MSAVLDYKRKIYAIRDLPTLPVIAQKVLTLADDDEAGPAKLAAIITSDQSLSAKVLSLANSAYYGHRAQIGTIRHAVVVIGTTMLKQLSLGALVFGTVGRGGKEREKFWEHSFATAMASRLIAQRMDIPDTELCFMGGLLHDIGEVIIEAHFPGDEEIDHAEVGAWMAERWQLPPQLVESIANHHLTNIDHLKSPVARCVNIANICAEVAFDGGGHPAAIPHVVAELQERKAEIQRMFK